MKIMTLCLAMLFATISWGMEYEVEFKQSQIQEQIDNLLPVNKQSMLAQIEVKEVQLTLLDKQDRVALAAFLNVITLGDFQTDAEVTMESGVRYDVKTGSFYFQNVEVSDLKAEKIPESLLPQLAILTEQVMNQVLVGYPIYTLDPTEINQNMLKSSLKAIKVRDKKLIAVMEL